MTTVLVVLIFLAVVILMAIYVPRYLLRRAIRDVVARFRELGAVSPESAATPQELGLGPRGVLESTFRMRDYRPYAVRMLAQADIIRPTEDGRIYLSEDELERSPVKRFAGMI